LPVGARVTGIETFREAARRVRAKGRNILSEPDAKRVLSAFGIPVPRSAVVMQPHTLGPASALSPPLAIKAIAPEIVHKSAVGGVRLAIPDLAAAGSAMAEMSARLGAQGLAVEGFLIEEMAPKGHEIVIGSVRDASFGPLVMFGLGGIFVEILKDVAFRICPVDAIDAREMIDEVAGAAILRGARGGLVVPDKVLIDAILAVGGADGIVPALGNEMAELDLNPLIATAHGVVAVDARMILAPDSVRP
jgi:acetate---CoA ligase (ADP-forming) subunit beta